jgi:hypothetical protein
MHRMSSKSRLASRRREARLDRTLVAVLSSITFAKGGVQRHPLTAVLADPIPSERLREYSQPWQVARKCDLAE